MSLVRNKKNHLEYSIEQKKVFGVELLGTEVKSLRKGQGTLDGARIACVNNQLFLVGAYIPAFQEKNILGYDAYHTRKLLANKNEIEDIKSLQHGQNLHVFPISFFDQHGMLKLECGIGKRLKKQDKREVIRKKDDKRSGV